jgi:hypothetical protein
MNTAPEKLKFEDNVPEPQISGNTVLIAALHQERVGVRSALPSVRS